MFKVFDYFCDSCHHKANDLIVEDYEVVTCKLCGRNMNRLFPVLRGDRHDDFHFQPFHSMTFDMKVRDREDLQRLKESRRKHNLVCVGHRYTKPDRKAIRNNYENDKVTVSALKRG